MEEVKKSDSESRKSGESTSGESKDGHAYSATRLKTTGESMSAKGTDNEVSQISPGCIPSSYH
jgi:hypothetical protein